MAVKLKKLFLKADGLRGLGYTQVFFFSLSEDKPYEVYAEIGTQVSLVTVKHGYCSLFPECKSPDDPYCLGSKFELSTVNAVFVYE